MQNDAYIKSASYFAVIVALVLVVSKFIAWNLSESVSLQASLVDSILDALASCVNFIVIRQALKPADQEHRFGHGKAEAIAGLGQSAFIAGSALWLLFEVVNRLIDPQAITHSFIGSMVMVLSIVLTLALVSYQRFVVKKTNSLAIAADSVHYQGDLFGNIGVLISLNISSYYAMPRVDALIGAAIGFYILKSSWDIFKQSLDVLMDRELSEPERASIQAIINDHPSVLGVHDLRTRSTGMQIFIQCHLDLLATLSLKEAHDIAYEVTKNLKKAYPQADIIIHQDPYGHDHDDHLTL
jgi:ferrous-iron efflux pump FieF